MFCKYSNRKDVLLLKLQSTFQLQSKLRLFNQRGRGIFTVVSREIVRYRHVPFICKPVSSFQSELALSALDQLYWMYVCVQGHLMAL